VPRVIAGEQGPAKVEVEDRAPPVGPEMPSEPSMQPAVRSMGADPDDASGLLVVDVRTLSNLEEEVDAIGWDTASTKLERQPRETSRKGVKLLRDAPMPVVDAE
jgi:hypothetical protein